ERRRHQTGCQFVELAAGVAQPGHLDDGVGAKMQFRTGRQPQQVDAARRYVLPHQPGPDVKPGVAQLVEQLGVDQMNLAQIGHSRVGGDPRAVLYRHALVSVTLDAKPREEAELVGVGLGQAVRRAAADSRYDPRHVRLPSPKAPKARTEYPTGA